MQFTPPISAYVLAGGRSSRMGTDKAFLQLAGKPLIQHAVTKLSRLTPNVQILSSNPALTPYGPLLPDIHSNTGPIGGLESALTRTTTDWNIFLPVDMPLIPTAFLAHWVQSVTRYRSMRIHVAMFSIFGRPQPALLLVRRDAARFLSLAIALEQYKLLPALEEAARELAPPDAPSWERVPFMLPIDDNFHFEGWTIPPRNVEPWEMLTPAQRSARPFWFANINTPQDLAEAEAHLDALDS